MSQNEVLWVFVKTVMPQLNGASVSYKILALHPGITKINWSDM